MLVPDQRDVELVESSGQNQREDDGQTAETAGKHRECLQLVPGKDLLYDISIVYKNREDIQQDKAPAINGQIYQSLERNKLEFYFSTVLFQSKR